MIRVSALDYTNEERKFLKDLFAHGMKNISDYCADSCTARCPYYKPCEDYRKAYLHIADFVKK